MNYKNMKIEISESQPLDDVVMELERLGYKRSKQGRWFDRDKIILTSDSMDCKTYQRVDLTSCRFYRLTTLEELKGMKND